MFVPLFVRLLGRIPRFRRDSLAVMLSIESLYPAVLPVFATVGIADAIISNQ